MVKIRRTIIIETNSSEEEVRIGEKIHKQLQRNEDYINNRIVVKMSITNKRAKLHKVRVYIYEDSKTDPEIKI